MGEGPMVRATSLAPLTAFLIAWPALSLFAEESAAVEKIRLELENNTKLEFVETPLKEVVEYLTDLHQIEIVIDEPALKAVGVEVNTPVTKNLSGITLRKALNLMLGEMELTWTIRDDALVIT